MVENNKDESISEKDTGTPEESEGKEEVEQHSTASLIEQTRATVKDLKEQNDRREKLIEREEKMQAEKMLGGKSQAGEPIRTEPKELTPKEYAKKVMQGEVPENE